MTCIDAWIPEQWKKDQPMTNFATDEIGTDDVNDDITDSKERGEIARDEFVTRFTEENTTLNYYDLRDHETVWEENKEEAHNTRQWRSIVHWHFFNVRQEKIWLVQDNGLLLDK